MYESNQNNWATLMSWDRWNSLVGGKAQYTSSETPVQNWLVEDRIRIRGFCLTCHGPEDILKKDLVNFELGISSRQFLF